MYDNMCLIALQRSLHNFSLQKGKLLFLLDIKMVQPSAQKNECPMTPCSSDRVPNDPVLRRPGAQANECPADRLPSGHPVPSHPKMNPRVVARSHRRSG